MFKIFKKPIVEEVAKPLVIEKNKPNRVYPKEVLEIHHAFNIAGEKLLAEAQSIIAQCDLSRMDKARRLESLGFKNVPEVVNFKSEILKKENAEEIARSIMKYRIEYPDHKFITPSQVKEICEKWGILQVGINRFEGFVPEKNLQEIENFVKRYRKENTLVLQDVTRFGVVMEDIILENACIRDNPYTSSYKHIFRTDSDSGRYAFQGNAGGDDFYAKDSYNIFGLAEYGDLNFTVSENPLFICAPKKDINTKGLRKVGHRLMNIPDPVVLYPVKNGYIVVTAWGPESADVLNENHN